MANPDYRALAAKAHAEADAATLDNVGAAAVPPESGDEIELLDYDPLFDDFEDDLTMHGLTVIHKYNKDNE